MTTLSRSGSSDSLLRVRKPAAQAAGASATADVSDLSPLALRGVLQNLREQQDELGMQSSELRQTQASLDSAQARYVDFYDLAPVGYVTVSQQALILQANLTTAALLGLPRDGLSGKRLTDFVWSADAAGYQLLCQRVLASAGMQSCELRLSKSDGTAVWVVARAMTATGDDGALVIRLVLSDIAERKQADATLLASTRLRDALLNSVPSLIAVLDYAGNIVAVNDRWRRFSRDNGTQPGQPAGNSQVGVNYLEICEKAEGEDSQEQARLVREGILRVINGSASGFQLEYPCHSPALQRWFSLAVTPLHVENHAVVVTHTDITQRRQMEQAAKDASEIKFRLVADNSSDGIVIFGADKRIQYVSPACSKLFGYPESEDIHCSLGAISERVHPEDRGRLLASLMQAVEARDRDLLCAYRFKHRLGHYLWREDSIRFQYAASGAFSGACVVARDITQRIAAEDEIRQLAYFDPLTGLPNRALLLDRLQLVMATCARTGQYAALLSVDMDNFKTLKHTLGQDVGDLLLNQVAQRLSGCVDAGDTVARLGGDEFMVLLTKLGDQPLEAAAKTRTVANNILLALSQPYPLGGPGHHCSASIGATLCPGSTASVDDLLKQVDLAMFHAKAVGPKVLRFFDPGMELGVKQRIALEKDLRHALAARQFVLHYQAQVDAAGRVTGAEVLVRWQHPQQGLVMPGQFISLAEETGVILALGHWVMETACAQLKVWAELPEMAQLTLAVNVSALQFAQPDFVAQVMSLVQRSGADPRRLKLELTESLLVGNVADIIGKMDELKVRGIGFSLDDFGTGFSSLAYLSRLPLDQLKIDRSFVSHVLSNPDDAAIARTIIALAHSLHLAVIAEGVETEEQRKFLADSGCFAYQGYFFGRPLALVDFETYVRRSQHKGLPAACA